MWVLCKHKWQDSCSRARAAGRSDHLALCACAGDRKPNGTNCVGASSTASNSMCPDDGLATPRETSNLLATINGNTSCLSVSFSSASSSNCCLNSIQGLLRVGSDGGCDRRGGVRSSVFAMSWEQRKTLPKSRRATHWETRKTEAPETTVARESDARGEPTSWKVTRVANVSVFLAMDMTAKKTTHIHTFKTPRIPEHRAAQTATFCCDRRP